MQLCYICVHLQLNFNSVQFDSIQFATAKQMCTICTNWLGIYFIFICCCSVIKFLFHISVWSQFILSLVSRNVMTSCTWIITFDHCAGHTSCSARKSPTFEKNSLDRFFLFPHFTALTMMSHLGGFSLNTECIQHSLSYFPLSLSLFSRYEYFYTCKISYVFKNTHF